MTRFQREALREVRTVPGVLAADFIERQGKHDRIKLCTPNGEKVLIVSATPGDAHALNQVIRCVRRALR